MPRVLKSTKEAELLNNRHCSVTTSAKNAIPFSTHLTRFNKTATYDSKLTLAEQNKHFGQTKLLMSEIQLLTMYYKNNPKSNPVIIYIGAAPGIHLEYLKYLFPKVKFILYDGAPFHRKLQGAVFDDTYELHNEFFTDEKCKELKKRLVKPDVDILFVSDIRLGGKTKKLFEEQVARDNELQLGWVKILKPKYSLLKFRLPYFLKHGQSLSYVKGKAMFQIWPKVDSTETRLLVTRANIGTTIKYDFKSYEETLFYHNKWVRRYCFPLSHVFDKSDQEEVGKQIYGKNNSYCTCYDCMAELYALQEYVKLSNSGTVKSIKPRSLATIVTELKKPYYELNKKTIPSGDARPALEAVAQFE